MRAAPAFSLVPALALGLGLHGCGPAEAGFELELAGQGLAPAGTTDFQIAFLTEGAPEIGRASCRERVFRTV